MQKTNSESNLSNSKWDVTCKRFVAYIDIMGFKDMVSRSTHEEIYEMMKKIDENKKVAENVMWGNANSKLVTTTTYSDSIMVYSKDGSYDSLHSFICTVSALSNDLLSDRIPHKGAVAFGKMTLDTKNSIFFGQPLIDAYLLQEEVAFYGIIIHGSGEEEMNKLRKNMFFTIQYQCPLKNGSSSHLVIYPMHSDSDEKQKYKEERAALFNAIKEFRYKTSGHLRKYVDNTEVFLKYVAQRKV